VTALATLSAVILWGLVKAILGGKAELERTDTPHSHHSRKNRIFSDWYFCTDLHKTMVTAGHGLEPLPVIGGREFHCNLQRKVPIGGCIFRLAGE